jgi:hypothetical protein
MLDLAIAKGWLALHGSGTYVKFIQTGAKMFARDGFRSRPRR